MEDIEFIKNFSKINITKIATKLKVNRGNLYSGRVAKEKLHIVRQEIESEIAKLYIRKGD